MSLTIYFLIWGCGLILKGLHLCKSWLFGEHVLPEQFFIFASVSCLMRYYQPGLFLVPIYQRLGSQSKDSVNLALNHDEGV